MLFASGNRHDPALNRLGYLARAMLSPAPNCELAIAAQGMGIKDSRIDHGNVFEIRGDFAFPVIVSTPSENGSVRCQGKNVISPSRLLNRSGGFEGAHGKVDKICPKGDFGWWVGCCD